MITNKLRWRYKLIYFNSLGEFHNYLGKALFIKITREVRNVG
jgi:hypothetical protein